MCFQSWGAIWYCRGWIPGWFLNGLDHERGWWLGSDAICWAFFFLYTCEARRICNLFIKIGLLSVSFQSWGAIWYCRGWIPGWFPNGLDHVHYVRDLYTLSLPWHWAQIHIFYLAKNVRPILFSYCGLEMLQIFILWIIFRIFFFLFRVGKARRTCVLLTLVSFLFDLFHPWVTPCLFFQVSMGYYGCLWVVSPAERFCVFCFLCFFLSSGGIDSCLLCWFWSEIPRILIFCVIFWGFFFIRV